MWSGGGKANVFKIAKSFSKANGLKVLENTFKGKLLSFIQTIAEGILGKELAWKFMKPLWQAASEQFAKSANGIVHEFLNFWGNKL